MSTTTDSSTRDGSALDRTTAHDSRDGAPPHTTVVLAIILVSYFMILLDNSIVFTGLDRIQSSLGFSNSGLAWITDAYTLVFGGLLLVGARAGDLVGRRRVFVVGLGVFSLASLLVGAAPTAGFAVAARALQGVGAAIVAPSSLALLTRTFPAGEGRTRAISLYAATAGIGASVGLVIGGAVADLLSWRVGFLINVPLGIAMMWLAPRFVPETGTERGHFDATGALSATLGVGALAFGIIHSAVAGWASPVTVTTLVAGVLLLTGLVLCEARAAHPIMPLRLFTSRVRLGGYLVRMLYLAAMTGFFFFTSQYLQGVLGFSALAAGLGFLPMTAVNFAVATGVGRVGARLGQTGTLLVGVASTLVGMSWLAQVDANSGYWSAVAAPMALIGAGQGLVFAPVTAFGLTGVDAADAGAASGLITTFHQIGASLGLGVLVAVSAHSGTGTASAAAELTDRVRHALAGGSVTLALALAVAVVLFVPVALRTRAPAPEAA